LSLKKDRVLSGRASWIFERVLSSSQVPRAPSVPSETEVLDHSGEQGHL
jgi:hypothetical protein